ncbi:MAG: hypothetical protein ACP5N2_06825 [Candidatus Nanoarchaeia archaeon]
MINNYLKLSKLFVLAFAFALILASSAYADCFPLTEDDPTAQVCIEVKNQMYNTTLPIINITFQETVNVLNYSLYRMGPIGTEYPDTEELLELEPGNGVVNIPVDRIYGAPSGSSAYQPKNHVNDGAYVFKIDATNIPNINLKVFVLFKINSTGIKFYVSAPKNKHVIPPAEKLDFAVSNNSVFFFELEAERPLTECRFSTYSVDGQTSLEQAFTDMFDVFTTNNTNKTKAYISQFNISTYFSGYTYNGYLLLLHVICNDSQGKFSYNQIWTGVDESPPTITLTASHNPVVDYAAHASNLSIHTDDRSACTLQVTNPNPLAVGKPIINRSLSFNFASLTEFLYDYQEKLVFNNQPNPYDYTFKIICDNLANLQTNQTYNISVDYEIPQSFEFYSPPNTISKSSVLVNGSSNTGGVNCMATLNETNPTSFITLTRTNQIYQGRQVYTGTITNNIVEGENTVYVNCTYMIPGVFSQKDFVVDRIAPTAPNITMDKYTCSSSKINAKLKSEDEGSGINKYYYNFTLEGDVNQTYMKSGTSTSGQISISIQQNKILGKTYTLKAWAEDDAGNKGSQSTDTIIISNNSIPECDDVRPRINIIANQDIITKEWSISVNCTDSESGCKQSFAYGIEKNSSKNCVLAQFAGLMIPLSVSESATFCAAVYDNNDNNATAEKIITVTYPISCTNLLQDGTETDLNCGGECPKCINGQNCIISNDCASNYCLLGVCSEPSCTDSILNGLETGTDCGGNCDPCAIGGACIGDLDCESLNCLLGFCAEATCTDNKKDGSETDTDCGGNCSACEGDKACLTTADCITGYCELATKTCQIDPLLDTDGDGLYDVWEEEYCGTITACNPDDDLDGDGYTNLEEQNAGTDPTDAADHPQGKKYNKSALILIVLGALCIIAGIVTKVLDVMGLQNEIQLKEEQEMKGTLGLIPKLTSLQTPQEKKQTQEDSLLRQQARNKTLKLKELERRKVMNQFGSDAVDSAEKISTKNSSSSVIIKPKSEDKKIIEQKKNKYIDAGSNEEYLELGKNKGDAFSKLKDLTEGKKTRNEPLSKDKVQKSEEKSQESQSELKKYSQGEIKKDSKKDTPKTQNKKPKIDDEVFDKLKKITKQAKEK